MGWVGTRESDAIPAPLPLLPFRLAGYEIMNCPSIRLHGGGRGAGAVAEAPFTVALLWAWLGDGSPNGNDAASARDGGEGEGLPWES